MLTKNPPSSDITRPVTRAPAFLGAFTAGGEASVFSTVEV